LAVGVQAGYFVFVLVGRVHDGDVELADSFDNMVSTIELASTSTAMRRNLTDRLTRTRRISQIRGSVCHHLHSLSRNG
jgi:hypothetical protein